MLPNHPLNKATAHKGMEVVYLQQYRGFIRELKDGVLDGMADIELPSGETCVHLSELEAADV